MPSSPPPDKPDPGQHPQPSPSREDPLPAQPPHPAGPAQQEGADHDLPQPARSTPD